MIKRLLTIILLALLPEFSSIMAQDTITIVPNENEGEESMVEDESSRCLTMKELIGFVHMPFDTIRDKLYDHGFRMGYYFDNEPYNDTVSQVVLPYETRAAFNHINNKNSVIWIRVPNNGLGNIVMVEKTGCDFYNELVEVLRFKYDIVNKYFSGSFISVRKVSKYMNNIDDYYLTYVDDINDLTIKDTTEIRNYVNATKAARWQHVQDMVAQAVRNADEHRYIQALDTLDSLINKGVLDVIVTGTRGSVAEQAEDWYFKRLNYVVNTLMRPDSGILICDTLLMFSKKQDSILTIRNMLLSSDSGATSLYSYYHPDEFSKVVAQLEHLINTEIGIRSEEKRNYHLKFDFTFQTDTGNNSFGHIELMQNYKLMPETEDLQAQIDEIARSPLIIPAYDHGIYSTTNQKLEADVKWRYSLVTIVDTCKAAKDQWLKPYIEEIGKDYFRVGQRPSIPTKCIYQFGVKEIEYHGETFKNVELVSFRTTSAASWMPSLIIPGLGTKLQGYNSSVMGRFIPFMICSTLAGVGIWYERSYAINHNIQRAGLTDDFEHIWELKYSGYILGALGGGLALAIYIDDIHTGIKNTINNFKRSSVLRKELKDKPKQMHPRDIRL